MPVIIWESGNGEASNHVETDWTIKWTPEEYREEAEALDRDLDTILDGALERVESWATARFRPIS